MIYLLDASGRLVDENSLSLVLVKLDLFERVDNLESRAIIVREKGVTRSVYDHGLHARCQRSLNFLDVVTQEENMSHGLVEYGCDLGIACGFKLQTRIRCIKPVINQTSEVFCSLCIITSSVFDVTKEQLLCKDATRGIYSKLYERVLPTP